MKKKEKIMLKILLAIYICISLYVLISTIVGMNEFAKMSGTKHHWFKYFCVILYSITPFLNVYIIYLSKNNRGEK